MSYQYWQSDEGYQWIVVSRRARAGLYISGAPMALDVMAGLVPAIHVYSPSLASPPSLPGLTRQSMRHRSDQNCEILDLRLIMDARVTPAHDALDARIKPGMADKASEESVLRRTSPAMTAP